MIYIKGELITEVYKSHLGGIYFSNIELDYEYLYCAQCGDSDWYLGHANTWEDVVDMITDEDGWCCYDEDYLIALKEEFKQWCETY